MPDQYRCQITDALRAVAAAPGEVIRPGEWAKAKALIAASKDVNCGDAEGVDDFGACGDTTGLLS